MVLAVRPINFNATSISLISICTNGGGGSSFPLMANSISILSMVQCSDQQSNLLLPGDYAIAPGILGWGNKEIQNPWENQYFYATKM